METMLDFMPNFQWEKVTNKEEFWIEFGIKNDENSIEDLASNRISKNTLWKVILDALATFWEDFEGPFGAHLVLRSGP